MNLQNLYKLVAIWAVALSVGCTKVGFSPTDPDYSANGNAAKTENFLFNKNDTTAKVDIMIIDDNSTSMLPAQEKFGTSLDSFIGSLGNIDWQIGVTTTDVTTGTYGLRGSMLDFSTGSHILTKNTPNYQHEFENVLIRPETQRCVVDPSDCPSSDERAMEAITLAMAKKDSNNAGFFRKGADLVVIVLTNEDESSDGLGPNLISAATVVATAKTLFGLNKSFTGFGLFIQPGDTTCYNKMKGVGGTYSTFVGDFVALTGGSSGSICDNDYGNTLSSIGDRVLQGIKTCSLKYMPTNPDEIIVDITPFDPTLTWTLEGKQITFNKAPAQGTKVSVTYLH